MTKIKVLNLYAGIGGNRKYWTDVDVTAIEIDPDIAAIYQDFFPDDKVIIADAHQYLLEHFKEFDFIWSSPPCPTHSDMRRMITNSGRYKPVFPDMKLYEEIILLKHFCKCKWVVENVKGYYNPLIEPHEIERHYFWSNFGITDFITTSDRKHRQIRRESVIYGFDVSKYNNGRLLLRNLVDPSIGLHVFECSQRKKQKDLFSDFK